MRDHERDCFSGRVVVRCLGCGTLQLRPHPTDEEISEFFRTDYFSESDNEFWGWRRQLVFRQAAQMLSHYGAHSVLDVGSGYGHFLAYLRERGFEPTGCDLSETAVANGRRRFDVDLRVGRPEELSLPPQDAITHLDALYYVSDPTSHLVACRRSCRRGGLLVLRVRTPDRLLPGGELPCPHIWGFTPDGLREVLECTGWRVRAIEPGAPSRHWTAPIQRGLRRLNRAARRVGVGGIWTTSFVVVAEAE